MVNKYDVDEKNTNFNMKNIFRLLSYTKDHKFKLFLAFLFSIIVTITTLFTTKIFQYVFSFTASRLKACVVEIPFKLSTK